MKVCDLCKKHEKTGDHGSSDTYTVKITTFTVGTDVRPMVIYIGGESEPTPIPIELCHKCNKKVNKEIAMHLYEEFKLVVQTGLKT